MAYNIKKRKFKPVSHSAADTGNPTFEDEDCTMLSGAEDTRQVKKVKRLASLDTKARPSRSDLQYWNEDRNPGAASDSDLRLLQDDVDSEECLYEPDRTTPKSDSKGASYHGHWCHIQLSLTQKGLFYKG